MEQGIQQNSSTKQEQVSDSDPIREVLFDSILEQPEQTNPLNKTGNDPDFDEQINTKQFICLPSKSDKIIFENALKNAPEKVKSVIEKDKELGNQTISRLNYLFFAGPPGTGKSTLSKAVGCDLGVCYFLQLGNLLSKHRHATSQRLNKIITAILKSPGKSVIVIDEINKLVENYMSENNDSGDTAVILWQKIDENKSNPNIFWIGTGNETTRMPPPLQDRFRHRFVEISLLALQDDRKELILYFLNEVKIPVDYLNIKKNIEKLANRTINFTVRDIEGLFAAAEDFARNNRRKGKEFMLTLECLEEAFKDRGNDNSKFIKFSFSMTDEEKRHKESIDLSKAQFEENKKIMTWQRWENRFYFAVGIAIMIIMIVIKNNKK